MCRIIYIVIASLLIVAGLVQAAPTAVIRGAVIRGAVIAPFGQCDNKAIGDSCGGGKYAGTLNGYRYVVTPGGCTNSSTPTCAGGNDTVTKKWAANNAGPSACCTVVGGCSGIWCDVLTDLTSTTNGSGNTTSLAMNYADTDAAKYCENMDYGGYTDWFLPAKDELNLLNTNRVALGGFVASWYCSSTEYNSNPVYVWAHYFSGGQNGIGKTSSFYIRCVRKY